jgi:hypothetical protein
MRASRRSFLKQLTAGVSALFGATQLSGCLGEKGDAQVVTSAPAGQLSTAAQSSADAQLGRPAQTADASQASPPATPDAPTQSPLNQGPIWQPDTTIEFVEGMPAAISVRQFVRDPDQDPLIISLKAGALIPGLTWDPVNATITYDGRPLGANDDTPIVVSGVVFSADDRKN